MEEPRPARATGVRCHIGPPMSVNQPSTVRSAQVKEVELRGRLWRTLCQSRAGLKRRIVEPNLSFRFVA